MADEARPATAPFEARFVTPPAGEVLIGGSRDAKPLLSANGPLLRRLCLAPDDIQTASLSLTLVPAKAGTPEVLAEGLAKDQDIVDLARHPALADVSLTRGSELILAVWRSQWHQSGGAELTSFAIERLEDGARSDIPAITDAPKAGTAIGTFALGGLSKRNKLPVLEKRTDAVIGSKAGEWTIPDAAGVTMESKDGRLTFSTRGQTAFGETWEWTPSISFTPLKEGRYRLTGVMRLRSGPPADRAQPLPMRWMVLRVAGPAEIPSPARLVVRDASAEPSASPLATLELPDFNRGKRQTVSLDNLVPLLRRWAASSSDLDGLQLSLLVDAGIRPVANLVAKDLSPTLSLRSYPKASLFESGVRPRPGVFARVRDGHLYYGDERLRLWGVVGYPDVGRLQRMGFNAQRVWNPRAKDMYDKSSAARGELKPYVRGDNSEWDKADRHLAALKSAGMFVQLATLTETIPPEWVMADDSFIAGGADWAEWKAAMSVKNRDDVRGWLFFDERLQRVRKQHAKNLLTWINPYTGTAYGQDECIAVYEIFNENGGVKRLTEGSYRNWPPYFQQKFAARWNDWLAKRYADDAALRAAWGKLDDGESLAARSVVPGPSFEQRNDYPKRRGSDFIRFVVESVDAFHQDFRSYCRTLAPVGTGVQVAPFSFDTQYRPSLTWSYLQSRGEVNCPGMYFWDLQSTLMKPPAAYLIDSHTVEGAATILYETNSARPGPYRAEYAVKLAALAGWQDWDGVFWHYWARGGGAVDEAYLADAMLHTTVSHYWNAVHHEEDPVMASVMALAGRAFLSGAIRPAPKPVTIDAGADAMFSYDTHNGITQTQQTFTSGSRMKFQADMPGGATADGKALAPPTRLEGAVKTGEQIVWDWPAGRLIIDTPTMKGYAGKIDGPYKFSDGIVLGDVGTPFVSFFLISADGKPLVGPDASKRVFVNAVLDAKNTGFEFDYTVSGGPIEQAKAIRNHGRPPVIVDPVPFAVWFPTTLQGRWQQYDFALRERSDQAISQTNKVTHDGREMFVGLLSITSRGEAAPVPEPKIVVASQHTSGSTMAPSPDVVRDRRWHPLAALSWDLSPAATQKAIRDSDLVYTSLRAAPEPAQAVLVSDMQAPALWSAPADLEISFRDGAMQKLIVTFKQPPPLQAVIADYEKQFGAAEEKKIASQFETSLARWPATVDRPALMITESQGVLKILYEVERE